jgi:hypothetical protein
MKLIFNTPKIIKKTKLKFFNIKSFPARSKAEWKLIDKNPFGDTDGDRVPNWFDCKPLNNKKQGWAHEGGLLYYPDMETKTKMMSPDKFLRTTFHEKNNTSFNNQFKAKTPNWTEYAVIMPDEENMNKYSKGVIIQEKVENYKKVIRSSKGKMDIPYLKYDEEGRPIAHEGRHRATAAKQLGVKLIPVAIMRQKRQKEYGEIKTIRQMDEYNKRRSREIDIQEKEQEYHEQKMRIKSADIPIQEQREYGEEKPEALQNIDQSIEIKEED